jgi:hypothetical protein
MRICFELAVILSRLKKLIIHTKSLESRKETNREEVKKEMTDAVDDLGSGMNGRGEQVLQATARGLTAEQDPK